MQRQVEMQEAMLAAHRGFMRNLEKALDALEKDLGEAAQMASICTGEWCEATESVIDELHKSIYSISEPRWAEKADHEKLRDLRCRVKDLYAQYKGTKA